MTDETESTPTQDPAEDTPLHTPSLPGIEPEESVEEIRLAALRLADKRANLKTAKKQADKAEEKLMEILDDHGRTRYFDAESKLLVEIEQGKPKLTVTFDAKPPVVGTPVNLDQPDVAHVHDTGTIVP